MKALAPVLVATASLQRSRLGPPGISWSRQARRQGSGQRGRFREARSRFGIPSSRRAFSEKKVVFWSSRVPTASRLRLPQLLPLSARASSVGSSGNFRMDGRTRIGRQTKAHPIARLSNLDVGLCAKTLGPLCNTASPHLRPPERRLIGGEIPVSGPEIPLEFNRVARRQRHHGLQPKRGGK